MGEKGADASLLLFKSLALQSVYNSESALSRNNMSGFHFFFRFG